MKNVKNAVKKLFGGLLVCLCLVSFVDAKCVIPEDIEDMYDEAKEAMKQKVKKGEMMKYDIYEYEDLVKEYWGECIGNDSNKYKEEIYRKAFKEKLGGSIDKKKESYIDDSLFWERKITERAKQLL